MADPTRNWLTTEQAAALEGTTDTTHKTGLPYQDHDQKASDTPSSYAETTSLQEHLNSLVGPAAAGLVRLSEDGGLNVAVYGIPKYQIGSTAYTLAGTDPVLLTANATNYIWCDADETVEQSTSDWPGTDHLKLAIVTTGATEVTGQPVDCRLMNFGIGGANNWWEVAAGGDVDLDGHDLGDVGSLILEQATQLTISAGSITPTQGYHGVTPESGSEDDLVTIVADASKVGQILIIFSYPDSQLIIVKDGGGNLNLENGDCYLTTEAGNVHFLAFIQHTTTEWKELFRSQQSPAVLSQTLDCTYNSLRRQGQMNFKCFEQTITSGTISLARIIGPSSFDLTLIRVDTEADAASDDLDSVTDGEDGDILILRPDHTDRTVVVKHAIGAGKFLLNNGLDFEMNSTAHTLGLRHNGTQWVELFRSPMRMESLVSDLDDDAGDKPSRCLPYAPTGGWFLSGVLTDKVYDNTIYCPTAFTIRKVYAAVGTAPSGGNLKIDVKVDGASIFAAQGEWITINDGNITGYSATKNTQVPAGSVITFEVVNNNSAANASITPDSFAAPQTAP